MTTPESARPNARAKASTEPATNAVSTRREDMDARIAYRPVPIKKPSLGSAAVRLHEMFGESPATWENRIYGEASVYRRVAQINGALRVLGLVNRLTELMMPVELSLGPEGVVALPEALHLAELADCREQEADESFRYKLSQGTATVAEAESYLRKSAAQCAHADVARREAQRWIAAQAAQ